MLAYCDKIADTIRKALQSQDPDGIINRCGYPRMDLHPEGGYFLSTKKTMQVEDVNGKRYRVTVEEV